VKVIIEEEDEGDSHKGRGDILDNKQNHHCAMCPHLLMDLMSN
jgi:hypothetical protein